MSLLSDKNHSGMFGVQIRSITFLSFLFNTTTIEAKPVIFLGIPT